MMVGPGVWPWERGAKVGWRSMSWSVEVGWTCSPEHWCQGNNSCDPSVQVLSEWRVVGVVWMTVRRGVEKDGMEIQGQGFLHEGGYSGIKLMSTRVWSEKSRILGSLPPTAQLWLYGLHTGPISRSPSHLRMLKFSWGSYFRYLLVLWVFLIPVLSLSSWYHTLLFIFTIHFLFTCYSFLPSLNCQGTKILYRHINTFLNGLGALIWDLHGAHTATAVPWEANSPGSCFAQTMAHINLIPMCPSLC